MSVTVTGWAEFNQFVKETKKFSADLSSKKFERKLLVKICTEAKNHLQVLYANRDSTQDPPSVSITYITERSAVIECEGDDVMFIEFGTGTIGERSGYQGDFPDSGVPITGTWVYNYPSTAKKTMSSGAIMWRVPDKSLWSTQYINKAGWSRGTPSFHQIYDTAIWIEQNMSKWLDEIVRTYYV